MEIIYSEDEFRAEASVLALGMFDGVHAGHQALIRRAVQLAGDLDVCSVVCTFDRHPMEVLCPEKAPRLLLTLEQRIEKFRALGVEWVLIKPFTRALADLPAEDFLRGYVRRMRAKAVVAGFNYTFGRCAAGNSKLIRRMAEQEGFRAEILGAVMDGAEKVSSTLIRRLQDAGEQARADRLMRLDV